jgi:hypothetical protein
MKKKRYFVDVMRGHRNNLLDSLERELNIEDITFEEDILKQGLIGEVDDIVQHTEPLVYTATKYSYVGVKKKIQS